MRKFFAIRNYVLIKNSFIILENFHSNRFGPPEKMIAKIWRVLAQILFYRNDLNEIIKPFLKNLKNENLNDEKYIPLLKTFSKDHLEVLYQNGIITEEKLNLFIPKKSKRK